MRNNLADITRCLISLTAGTRLGLRSRLRWLPFRRFKAENLTLDVEYKLLFMLFIEFLERSDDVIRKYFIKYSRTYVGVLVEFVLIPCLHSGKTVTTDIASAFDLTSSTITN